jgi:hypothetical protein
MNGFIGSCSPVELAAGFAEDVASRVNEWIGLGVVAGTRPGGRLTFLLVQASRQRSTPRRTGLSMVGCPRCKTFAGPASQGGFVRAILMTLRY